MKNKQYRQGDVFIERISKIPTNAKRQKADKHVILAHGEVTGHHHSFDVADASHLKLDSSDYFEVTGKNLDFSLPIVRQWKGQVLVEHPQKGLIEFAVEDIQIKGDVVVVSGNFALLKHQEHNQQAIPAGFYRGGVDGSVRQREYTPQAIRNVAD